MGEARRRRAEGEANNWTADGHLQFPTLDGRTIPLARIIGLTHDDPSWEMETALLDDGDMVVLNLTSRSISVGKRARYAARLVDGKVGEFRPITGFERAAMERAALYGEDELVRLAADVMRKPEALS
jgi:hypothetical protein